MSAKRTRTLPGILGVLLWTAAASDADTVVLAGKPPFRNVYIVSFRHGRLYFRGMSKEILKKPLAEVVRFELDRCPALTSAEALTHADPHAAMAAYEQALGETHEDWLHTLVRVRLLGLYDRAGRFDDAVALYIRLTREQPEPANVPRPHYPAPPGSARNRRARDHLFDAIKATRTRPALAAVRTLALELLLFDEADPLPPEFAPPAARPARPPTTQSDTPPPLLFDEGARRAEAPLSLPPDSFVLSGVRQALAASDVARAARLLDRSLPYVAEREAPAWRLLQGRCLIELGQHARAADELLALTQPPHDRSLAAEALYYVGLAHERMERADIAAGIYRELLRQNGLPAETQRLAVQGLKRLGE
jgi:tetratricopeptide (TPR) repeat protein